MKRSGPYHRVAEGGVSAAHSERLHLVSNKSNMSTQIELDSRCVASALIQERV